MPRISRWVGLVVLWKLLVGGVAWGEVARPCDTLLPKTTVGFATATTYKDLVDHWSKTQLGKLLADPVMQPFEKEARERIQSRWTEVGDRLGLKLEDLKGVPAGEIALALIEPNPGEAATAMLIDVTGHLPQANAVLAKARANLLKQGAKERRATIEGATVLLFDLPLPKDEQEAASQAGAAASEAGIRQTIYFIAQNFFGVSDSLQWCRTLSDVCPARAQPEACRK